jgi:type II secretory pathway pseudopilin PulG
MSLQKAKFSPPRQHGRGLWQHCGEPQRYCREPQPHCREPQRRRGFTLIEAAMATVIIGTGLLASVRLFAACTQQNAAAGNMTTAMLLASHIQETMAGLPIIDPAYASTYFGPEPGETLANYDDVDDFDGSTFNPPIDATRAQIAGLSQYSQVITVLPVYANQLNSNTNPAALDLPKTTYTGAVRVQVKVMYKTSPNAIASEVFRTSWIRVSQY